MNKLKVLYEEGDTNWVAVIPNVNRAILCTADSFEELKEEVIKSIEFHIQGLREDGMKIPLIFQDEYELVYEEVEKDHE